MKKIRKESEAKGEAKGKAQGLQRVYKKLSSLP